MGNNDIHGDNDQSVIVVSPVGVYGNGLCPCRDLSLVPVHVTVLVKYMDSVGSSGDGDSNDDLCIWVAVVQLTKEYHSKRRHDY